MNGWHALPALAALALAAGCGDGGPTQVAETPPDLGPQFLAASSENVIAGGGACMGDDALAGGRTSGMQSASNLNCTANDVSLAVATITHYSTDNVTFVPVTGPVSCIEGSDIWVTTTANLVTNATERYDIGIWIPDLVAGPLQDPANAVTGKCRQWNLLNDDPGGAVQLDGDQCGDVSSATASAASPTTQALGTLKLKCEDVDPNFPGQLAVGACLGWNNNRSGSQCPLSGNGAIDFRFGTTPETKSKCNCDPMLLPIAVVQQGSIELKKAWSGTPGQTTLQVGTTAGAADVASQLTGAAGAAPLTTGAQSVNPGTFYVSETGGLANYSSALACTRNGSPFTPGAGNSVAVASNDVVVCTFTNTRQAGSIELKKAWVGTGGQVTLNIGTTAGTSDVASQQTGAAGAAPLTTGPKGVDTGTYFVSEAGLSGDYTASLACTRDGTPFTPGAGNSVAVGSGETVVCTFTNTRQTGSVELLKVWSGSPGQTTLNVGRSSGASDVATQLTGAAGAAPLTTGPKTVETGTYHMSEVGGIDDYDGVLACTKNGANFPPASDNSVVVGNGDAVVCAFTNTRQTGTIELKKAWSGTPDQVTLHVGTTAGASDVAAQATGAAGAAPLTTGPRVVDTGSYFVSETGLSSNYTSSLACTRNGSPFAVGAGNSVGVGKGDAVVCTFTNTRKPPQLSITKTPDAGEVNVGGTATFTIDVMNAAGAGSALNTVLTDTLPNGGLSWSIDMPVPAGCSISPIMVGGVGRDLLTCNVGELNAGASFSVSVSATIPANYLQPVPGRAGLPLNAGDGNLTVNGGEVDWATALLGINCLTNTGCNLDQPSGGSDDSFGGGTDENTAVPTVGSGSIPPNKSDLTRFYIASERVGTFDYLYLGWRRVQNPSGTTNMDFELNQSTQTSANGITPIRTVGDLLITYDLAQGGVTPVLGFRRWIDTGTCGWPSGKLPCWGPRTELNPVANDVAGAVNTGSVADPFAPSPATLSPFTFGEASINLQLSGIFQPGVCLNFGRAYLKSRSSDSPSSALKDFIAPVAIDVNSCIDQPLNNRAWVVAATVSAISDTGLITVRVDPITQLPAPATTRLAVAPAADPAPVLVTAAADLLRRDVARPSSGSGRTSLVLADVATVAGPRTKELTAGVGMPPGGARSSPGAPGPRTPRGA